MVGMDRRSGSVGLVIGRPMHTPRRGSSTRNIGNHTASEIPRQTNHEATSCHMLETTR